MHWIFIAQKTKQKIKLFQRLVKTKEYCLNVKYVKCKKIVLLYYSKIVKL